MAFGSGPSGWVVRRLSLGALVVTLGVRCEKIFFLKIGTEIDRANLPYLRKSRFDLTDTLNGAIDFFLYSSDSDRPYPCNV